MRSRFYFSQSLLCFWIRGKATVTDTSVEFLISERNLALVPRVKPKTSYFLNQIKKISVHTEHKTDSIAFGTFLILIGVASGIFFSLLFSWSEMFASFRTPLVCAAIALLSGVGLFLSGFPATFAVYTYTDPAVASYEFSVPFYEKGTLSALGKAIKRARNNAS